MTINPYVTEIQKACPDTYVGIMAYLNRVCNNNGQMVQQLISSNTYTLNAYLIGYIEYRGVSFLESISNTHYDYPDLNYNALTGKAITNTLYRLEKNLLPIEGKQF